MAGNATMDFFESQSVARKKTGRLVIMFIVAVILMIVVLHLITAAALLAAGYKFEIAEELGAAGQSPFLNPIILATVTGATLLIVLGGSAYKIAELAGGGRIVAESLGGQKISPDTTDPDERKLLNVVEEMAIASGISVPPVYLLDRETGINAFAAGYSPDDAVIGITRGSVELLSRDELQGVIAHEFSHILNGDMRLNIRLIGILNGLLILGILGYYLLRVMFYSGGGRRRSSKEGGSAIVAILIIAAGMMAVGFVGTFFGNLIKSAVSRQREYLADASAVQFTRNPEGIGHALQKIGGYVKHSTIAHPNAPQASHMYFSKGVTAGLESMFATHPPLRDRIRRVLPSWDGKFSRIEALPEKRASYGEGGMTQEDARRRFEKIQVRRAGAGAPQSEEARRRAAFGAVLGGAATMGALEAIGRPSQQHVDHARDLIDAIPEEIRDAAREPYRARAVVLALLIDRSDEECRTRQLEMIERHSEYGLFEQTKKIIDAVMTLDTKLRLPLIDLALPALKQLSISQYKTFQLILRELIEADEKVDLFEWSLQRILGRHLTAHFEKPDRAVVQYYGLQRLGEPCAMVLSILAHAGADTAEEAQDAFRQGVQQLGFSELQLIERVMISWKLLDGAIAKLNQVAPALKRKIIEACAVCIFADREVREDEAELFRAIADALRCPVPPILPSQQSAET